ncbi:hypothetical protein BHM03_00009952, partial [Ensete ventricosum]
FLDFSSAKRGNHRRSVSDSIAFLEHPLEGEGSDFDRFDDDQLMSMFSDDMPPSSLSGAVPASSSSTPSDHNSINEDKPADQKAKNESEEAQSACKEEPQAVAQPATGAETIVDPKRVKRYRSRVRKLQYISELERSVTTLQVTFVLRILCSKQELSALSPRVAFLDHQRSLLTLGNSHLKQRIAALAQDKLFKDVFNHCKAVVGLHSQCSQVDEVLRDAVAHQEALKKEIERLRQVYHQQNLKKMAPPTSEPAVSTEKELLS